ncbi:MAG: endo-1,4-beta-xylanase [Verrucomicrobiota bacterium]
MSTAQAQDKSPIVKRDPQYGNLWQDPQVEQRINAGIQLNRMGFATIRFVDAQSNALNHVEIKLEQTRHEFLFGCNLFMLDGFPSAELNQRHEEAFCSVFNLAVLPFFWRDLEPEPGKLRFAKDSPRVYRRPPPDRCLEFCQSHGITPKGHLLIWHQWLPNWLPDNQDEVKRLMIQRFEQIAARYGKDIKYWDVVDEALYRPPEVPLPKDYVYTAMQEAARIFPRDAKLDIGDAQLCLKDFHLDSSPYYLMIHNLLLRNARLDAVGLSFQTHFLPLQQYSTELRPLEMFRLLDQYADFRLPIQFTQVTVPGLPAGAEGEKNQAETVRNVYRLWFSHPNVEMINWWNLVDGTAVPSENKWLPGLLREDLSRKPAFEVLYNLIRNEWWTKIQQNSGPKTSLKIQGFYGDYQLIANHGGNTLQSKIHLTKGGMNEFVIQFP